MQRSCIPSLEKKTKAHLRSTKQHYFPWTSVSEIKHVLPMQLENGFSLNIAGKKRISSYYVLRTTRLDLLSYMAATFLEADGAARLVEYSLDSTFSVRLNTNSTLCNCPLWLPVSKASRYLLPAGRP